VLASFEAFVHPMVRMLHGTHPPRTRKATVAEGWRSPPGRQQFMPVVWAQDGTVAPATAGGSGSHLVARLATAEALAVVPADTLDVRAGDSVEVMEITA
jgi:molybdopterin molybdotransferase